jgi:hypothetical protein
MKCVLIFAAVAMCVQADTIGHAECYIYGQDFSIQVSSAPPCSVAFGGARASASLEYLVQDYVSLRFMIGTDVPDDREHWAFARSFAEKDLLVRAVAPVQSGTFRGHFFIGPRDGSNLMGAQVLATVSIGEWASAADDYFTCIGDEICGEFEIPVTLGRPFRIRATARSQQQTDGWSIPQDFEAITDFEAYDSAGNRVPFEIVPEPNLTAVIVFALLGAAGLRGRARGPLAR